MRMKLPAIWLMMTCSCMQYFDAHAGLQFAADDYYEFWLLSERSLIEDYNLQFRIYSDDPRDEHFVRGEVLVRNPREQGEVVSVYDLRTVWLDLGKPEEFEPGPPFEYLVRVRRSDLKGFPGGRPIKACAMHMSMLYYGSSRSQDLWLFPSPPIKVRAEPAG